MKIKETVRKVSEVSRLIVSKMTEKSDLSFIKEEGRKKKVRLLCAVALPVAVLGLLGLKHIAMSILAVCLLLMVLSEANLDALLTKMEKPKKKVVSDKKEEIVDASEKKEEK